MRIKGLRGFRGCGTISVATRVMTVGPCAASCREPCQGRKAAAISGSWRAPRERLAWTQCGFFYKAPKIRFASFGCGGKNCARLKCCGISGRRA